MKIGDFFKSSLSLINMLSQTLKYCHDELFYTADWQWYYFMAICWWCCIKLMYKCDKCVKKYSNFRLMWVKTLQWCSIFVSNPLVKRWCEYKPIKYEMVRLAASSLCTCDADEDVVYGMRVWPGRDEVLKVGELTDTGTDRVSRSALDWWNSRARYRTG